MMEKEFCQYLKERHFSRFMEAWKLQYEKLGRVGGAIHISLDEHNRDDIEMLMQKSYQRQTHVKITHSSLIKVLNKTKYSGVVFEEVLHLYFNNIIVSQKDKKKIQLERDLSFINSMILEYEKTFSAIWLQSCIEENNYVFIRLRQEFNKSPKHIKNVLNNVMNALNQLPLKHHQNSNIVVFANEMTRDPHGFDKSKFAYYLLIQGVRYLLEDMSQDERTILHKVGLYEDTINNYCMICHIDAYDNDNQIHQGWHGFYLNYEMWNLNLQNVINVSGIVTHEVSKIFIVENPSIFAVLCDHAKKNSLQQFGFICTNGQLHTAAYMLLDLLAKHPIELYYGGDFDPEGLMIADRLVKRYHNLNLWHYDIGDYFNSLSDKHASKKRLAINSKLSHPSLIAIGKQLENSTIGYQENLLNQYLDDLSKWKR